VEKNGSVEPDGCGCAAVGHGSHAGAVLDHNEGFRRSILAKVEDSVRESTGARLEVRDFNLRLSNLSMDLYN